MGLHDAVLVKDNHLATIPLKDWAAYLNKVVSLSRAEDSARAIEVEVASLEQLRETLKVDGVDIILLDNMDCPSMETAVAMRKDALAGRKSRPVFEASGGITLDTVRTVALTGVERIAVGAITHSAAALDISLEIEQ